MDNYRLLHGRTAYETKEGEDFYKAVTLIMTVQKVNETLKRILIFKFNFFQFLHF